MILVVDDEQHIRDLIRIWIGEGDEVVECQSVDEAISELQRGSRPRMIFCDVRMPEKLGWELLAWVKRQSHLRDVPFVMMTASLSDPVRCVTKLDTHVLKALVMGARRER